ncbi:M57 family metalloprotease [Aquimarina sp. RZ0]|uniref:M57 family metalloprotease n=1 Tax=Aquimarina sp. RZ0 TaxID=2607730 RepID=UPI00165FDCEE|nr:M57 family metalloprotease [Aquimarina sp. RZ0]
MKIFRNLQLFGLLVIIYSLTQCTTAEVHESFSNELEEITDDFSPKITKVLENLGFNPIETKKDKVVFPDGTTNDFYTYQDMSYSDEAIEKIMNQEDTPTFEKQFRTFNTVGGNRNYTIAFFDFNQPFQRQAAGDAVFLFNNTLRTTIRLNIVFANGSNFASTPKDIAVFYLGNINTIAVADLPSNGLPGKNIRLNFRSNLIGTRARLRNTIMHEVGHTFGLRHTDFGLTGQAPDQFGRVPIPGTDTSGFDISSIMTSGQNSNPFGGYTDNDIRAIRFLYGFR